MRAARLCGWLGLLAAILVGLGEGLLQYSPGGDLTGYDYLADIPQARQSLGHWVAVLSAPLYLPGYWFLSRLFPRDVKLATAGFFLMSYAFILGAVWMGGRIDLALTSHIIAEGGNVATLQASIAAHNEPLVNGLRIAILIWSIFWIGSVASGRSLMPRWMALFSPALILGSIFALWFAAPAIGDYLLPAAMNVTHVILFGLALWTTRRSA